MLGRRARQGHERLAEALRAGGRRFSAPALCWSPPPPRRYPHASRARPHNAQVGDAAIVSVSSGVVRLTQPQVGHARRGFRRTGVAMESKPNPFLVASLMNGGDQTLLHLTLATAVAAALAIFVAAFLLGLCCGCMRRRQQTRLQAAADLKRRARA